MKRFLTKEMMVVVAGLMIGVLSAGTAQAVDANDPNADNLFDINRVLSLYIYMDVDDYNDMRLSCPGGICPVDANDDHQYWPATIISGTQGPMFVAIRRKNDLGEPTDADPQKVSLKIDINRYVPGQLFAGKKKLSLECGSEGALVSEGLSFNILQAAGVVSGSAA